MSARTTRKLFVAVVALALGLASLAAACGSDADTVSGSTTTIPAAEASTTTEPLATTAPATTTTTTTQATTTTTTTQANTTTTSVTATTTTTTSPVEMTQVNVYWGSNVLNPSAGSPERIGAGTRDVAADVPVRNSLEAMFDGLNAVEQTIGMTTSIPPGTKVLGIAIDGATATVDLSAEFVSSSGSLDETMRLAQVVFTVTQFDGIDRVKFHIDGVVQDPILSHGFVVGDGFTRDSFAEVRASIMIEQPYPGAEIADPLVIRGESNTFEATVRYAITSGGGDGLLLTEGFTTASGGNGTWGTFEVIIDVSDFSSEYQPGPGTIIMWEDSPRDGAQVNVVEIPIVLPER
jgi:germination protein M